MATDGVRSEQPKPFINVDRLLVHMLVKDVLGTCIRVAIAWCPGGGLHSDVLVCDARHSQDRAIHFTKSQIKQIKNNDSNLCGIYSSLTYNHIF